MGWVGGVDHELVHVVPGKREVLPCQRALGRQRTGVIYLGIEVGVERAEPILQE